MPPPDIVSVGSVFLDDIVYPDGRCYEARLGGAAIHALMAMSLWHDNLGMLCYIGNNFPAKHRELFETLFDTQGLIELPIPQMRAWQYFSVDGQRSEVPQVAVTEPFIQAPTPRDLPESYRHSPAMYLIQSHEGILRWHDYLPALTLWEPNPIFMTPEYSDDFRAALNTVRPTIVSPNLIEAQQIYGPLNPNELATMMLQDGARIVVLRMGAEGSLVANEQHRIYQEALPVIDIIDETGAGNSYCGAFLVGIFQGKHLGAAAKMGAYAASLCLQQQGILSVT